jgi:hypothetical protein
MYHNGAFGQPLWPWKCNILNILKVFVTLFIQHAKRTHCIILSSVAYLAVAYFTKLSHNETILGKKGTEYKTRVWCYLQVCLKHFHSKKNSARNDHKCALVFIQSTFYFCHILLKLEFYRQIFRKLCKYQISWKSARWEQGCSMRLDGRKDGQTGRLDETNIRFLQFCERA